jgi:hypothetical protein
MKRDYSHKARGGHARAAALSPERRADIARNAALARWGKPMLKFPKMKKTELPNWPRWGSDPHNPWSGQNRPAFNWTVFHRYAAGEVDADGHIVKRNVASSNPSGLQNPTSVV